MVEQDELSFALTVRRVGNSKGGVIPQDMTEKLGIQAGDTLELKILKIGRKFYSKEEETQSLNTEG